MLVSGGLIRATVALIYLSVICASTILTYTFYSEPVLFCFVLFSVTLLVLSYPMLCLFVITRTHDLDLVTLCNMEWVPVRKDLVIQVEAQEKPSRLDTVFAQAYM